MKKRTVIHKDNLPFRMPIWATILWPTALDYWNAPQWLWGIAMFILALAWLWYIIREETTVHLFEKDEQQTSTTQTKSKFQQKLEERKNQTK